MRGLVTLHGSRYSGTLHSQRTCHGRAEIRCRNVCAEEEERKKKFYFAKQTDVT